MTSWKIDPPGVQQILTGVIIVLAALVFSWEAALYALMTLFIWGVVADYVLEGTLQAAGQEVRIAVQLVDAGTGVALWT